MPLTECQISFALFVYRSLPTPHCNHRALSSCCTSRQSRTLVFSFSGTLQSIPGFWSILDHSTSIHHPNYAGTQGPTCTLLHCPCTGPYSCRVAEASPAIVLRPLPRLLLVLHWPLFPPAWICAYFGTHILLCLPCLTSFPCSCCLCRRIPSRF